MSDDLLTPLLLAAGVQPAGVYRPGEVCRALRISRTTLLNLCDLAEAPGSCCRSQRGLESFRLGTVHRFTHTALNDWLIRNQSYQRSG